MLGRKDRDQAELFVTGSLRQLIPDDRILARVDRVLDLSWLRAEVGDLYGPDNGRPGIDPEVAVRLMLAGFLLGLVHDRRLMREAQVNLAIRWFVGYGLHETLPDHSSLTRIRQRWGPERFKAILTRSVQACVAAGIAKGEVVHIDASLIRADVTWDAIADAHADAVTTAHPVLPDAVPAARAPPSRRRPRRACKTDPNAALGKVRRNLPAQPSYKQHTAVDQACGVVLDVVVTTGATHESTIVEGQIDTIVAATASRSGSLHWMPATPSRARLPRSRRAASRRWFRQGPNGRPGRASFRCGASSSTRVTTMCAARVGAPCGSMANRMRMASRLTVPRSRIVRPAPGGLAASARQ